MRPQDPAHPSLISKSPALLPAMHTSISAVKLAQVLGLLKLGQFTDIALFFPYESFAFRSKYTETERMSCRFSMRPSKSFLSPLCATGLTHRSPQGPHQWTPLPTGMQLGRAHAQHWQEVGEGGE